ncbi:MAG TPA: sodium:proton exchanger [Dehalococcoidia bacterium]|nr:sodium:proton exchanger [Dehalococcoidia bacterium]
MDELGLGLDLIIVLAVAIAGGMLARRLRLPIILGYLVGGIAVGPYGFGLVQDQETIRTLANIGVILLLFTLGLEFSLSELKRIGKVAILGGIAQILLTAAVGLALGKLLGWAMLEAIFFGFLIALSSTMIVLKTLMERGELDSGHGRVMIGILLVQDLSLVPLMIILPTMGGGGGELWLSLGMATLKTLLFIGVMLVLGIWVLPWLLRWVAGTRSRELFLLIVVALCLGAAFGAFHLELSPAVGAFITGLLIGQSAFARQAFADIVPLRDTFGALFFVSLGMLASLDFVVERPITVAVVVIAIIVIKFIICFLVPWLFNYSFKTALFTGMGLLQIGEFSFVLAGMGMKAGIITSDIYSLTLTSAIITMLLTPFTLSFASLLYQRLSQKMRLERLVASRLDPDWQSEQRQLSGHAVICGYGRVGRNLAKVLERRNLSYLAIDLNPQIISQLHARGIPCIYGDASNREILGHAQLKKARVLICTFPDFMAVELTTRNALKINPKLDIVARVHHDADAELLKGIGVAELVLPEFEVSLEIIRHTLHRFGLTILEIQHILCGLRGDKG